MQQISPECKEIMKKRSRINIIVGLSAILIIIFAIFFLFYNPHFINALASKYFSSISSLDKKNAIIIEISDLCSNFNDSEKKLVCVNNFVRTFFNYVEHNDTEIIRTPNQLLNGGGVCRDYAVFYDAILKNMGFKTKYVYSPHHVYLKVIANNNTYYFDQELLWEGKPKTENP